METMKIQISTISAFCLQVLWGGRVAASYSDKTRDKICPGHYGEEESSVFSSFPRRSSLKDLTVFACLLSRHVNFAIVPHITFKSRTNRMSERLAPGMCTREILITIIINKIFCSL